MFCGETVNNCPRTNIKYSSVTIRVFVIVSRHIDNYADCGILYNKKKVKLHNISMCIAARFYLEIMSLPVILNVCERRSFISLENRMYLALKILGFKA